MYNDDMPEEDLKLIEQWELLPNATSRMHELFDFIKPYWEGYGVMKRKGNKYYLATGGWSGNEAIISALAHNRLFWSITWQKSERGGAYWFTVPVIKETKRYA